MKLSITLKIGNDTSIINKVINCKEKLSIEFTCEEFL